MSPPADTPGAGPPRPLTEGDAEGRSSAERLRQRRVLVVAHDFPPVRSPQSVRAMAFVRELVHWGAEVHVLTRTRLRGLPATAVPEGVTVWSASPGHWESMLDAISRRRRPAPPAGTEPASSLAAEATGPVRLNWKGKLDALARRLRAQVLFPDDRIAWVPGARRELARLAHAVQPDVALVMHEPAATLVLARSLPGLGIPWLADLADPVLAGYTPWHWRGRARRLEADTLRDAAAATVTNAATARLLRSRHPWATLPIEVVPQGFEPQHSPPIGGGLPLRLVYTGRFYAFRPADCLLKAVLATPGVELHIAGPEMPADVLDAASRHPDRILLHGELEHRQAIALQRTADVLVSIGNRDAVQTPGKVYEYFGIARPVLHLQSDAADPVPALLAQRRRGVTSRHDGDELRAALGHLLELKRSGRLAEPFDLSTAAVEDYTWRRLGQRMAGLLADIAKPR